MQKLELYDCFLCQLTQVSLFHQTTLNSSIFQRFGFSSASPEPNEKEQGSALDNNGAKPNRDAKDSVDNNGAEAPKPNGDAKASDEGMEATDRTKESGFDSKPQSTMSQSNKRRRKVSKRTAFSDSDSESEIELSRDDLVKLLKEREELLMAKNEEMKQMQDKVLRSFAEMENVKDRTIREAENSKKFAIQVFLLAYCLLIIKLTRPVDIFWCLFRSFTLMFVVLQFFAEFCEGPTGCCRQFGKSFFSC